jgi:hypothetical protein
MASEPDFFCCCVRPKRVYKPFRRWQQHDAYLSSYDLFIKSWDLTPHKIHLQLMTRAL